MTTTHFRTNVSLSLIAAAASLLLASAAMAATPAAAPKETAQQQAEREAHAKEVATAKPVAVTIEYGKKDAPVLIEEFASLSCSHCAEFAKNIQPELKKRYLDTGKARLVTHSYIRNEPDLRGSMLLHCLTSNEERQQFVKVLLEMQEQWAYSENVKDALGDIAKVGGVSPDTYQSCVSDTKLETGLLKDLQVTSETRNIEGTPSFFINGEKLVGGFDIVTLGKAIDAAKPLPAAAKIPAAK